MLDLYRDVNLKGDPEALPKSISYRAMSPLYVNDKYRVILDKEEGGDGKWKVELFTSFGTTGSKGTIVE